MQVEIRIDPRFKGLRESMRWVAQDTLDTSKAMDILDFSDIDFERITFNTLDTPQVIAFNKKVKKFIVLQIIFKNDTLDEGFGIYGVQVQYVVGGYVK